MDKPPTIDHLFRHQHGKMVSILTRIFGLSNLELIEDAIQDTFISAIKKWQNKLPENPEAWLTQAAKNRVVDLLRKVKADHNRIGKIQSGPAAISMSNLFLEHEIEDSQLRMIFVACHPELNPKDQIAFALKTIAGFNTREIASSLLIKEETIKKRLSRARKNINDKNLKFVLPPPEKLESRIVHVLEVIYLIFNEGFHSGKKDKLIRHDLCGEAIRLCKILLKKPSFRQGNIYSLFALLCFHAARLESKVDKNGEVVTLKNQNRTLWHQPLIQIALSAVLKATELGDDSTYFYEASIAMLHATAPSFQETNWKRIIDIYRTIEKRQSNPIIQLNLAVIYLHIEENQKAISILNKLDPSKLEQRSYLYYATLAEYHIKVDQKDLANKFLALAIEKVSNNSEKKFLNDKKKSL